MLTRDDMIRALRKTGPETLVSEVMHQDVPVVHYNASFDEGFRLMQQCQCPGLCVVNDNGELIGIVTPENVGEMMMVRSIIPSEVPSWRRHELTAPEQR
jgi:predicted transcriptional regulator